MPIFLEVNSKLTLTYNYCKNCGSKTEQNYQTCMNCGVPRSESYNLSEQSSSNCSNCGSPFQKNDKYCSNCGYRSGLPGTITLSNEQNMEPSLEHRHSGFISLWNTLQSVLTILLFWVWWE